MLRYLCKCVTVTYERLKVGNLCTKMWIQYIKNGLHLNMNFEYEFEFVDESNIKI